MAKWVVYQQRTGNLVMLHVNLMTGRAEKLGFMRKDTPEEMMLDWIVKQGDPGPFDFMVFSSGRVCSLVPVGDA